MPLSATCEVGFEAEVLAIVNVPDAAPTVVGVNATLTVAVCPGWSVAGSAADDTRNPLPVSVAELITRATDPFDVSVTSCVAVSPRSTLPNVTLLVLILREGTAATMVSVVVAETLLATAVSVAVCVAETADACAVKLDVVAPAATVVLAGRVTEVLLLVSVTTVPPLGAATDRLTVQVVVPAPVSELGVHASSVGVGDVDSTAVPVPLKSTTVGLVLAAFVVTVTCPLAVPTAIGENMTLKE